jgi:hypoxanthine phosphoribosyltransferase
MITIKDKTFVPFITAETIQERIQELAQQINQDYADKQPLIVVVLNGAFLFAADLAKHLTIPCEITFIRVASYTATSSSGQVKQILGLNESLEGRDIIVVEDIVDTGLTLAQVCEQLQAKGPASLSIATLLFKPDALKQPLDLQYIGFEIENRFVLGYGLDYDGLGRNTPNILVLNS